MPEVIKAVQPLAFRLPENLKTLDFEYRAMVFPEFWRELVEDVCQEPAWQKYKYKAYKPHPAALHKLLLALFPKLIHVDASKNSPFWLYSREPLDATHLLQMAQIWLQQEFQKGGVALDRLLRATGEMSESEIEWTTANIDFAKIGVNEQNTATFNAEFFKLLPEMIAESLTRPGRMLPFGARRLRFYRAPSLGGNGVELVSWQPMPDGRNEDHYSIFLRISLQTVARQPFPQIHIDVGTRRWVSRVLENKEDKTKAARLGAGNHTVFLMTSIAGENSSDEQHRFQIAEVSNKKIEGAWQIVWMELFPQLCREFFGENHLPDLSEAMKNPLKFADKQQKTQMAFVYKEGMPPGWHNVGKGVPPAERRQIFHALSNYLAEDLGILPIEKLAQVKIRAAGFKTAVEKVKTNQLFARSISDPKDKKTKQKTKSREQFDGESRALARIHRNRLAAHLRKTWNLNVWQLEIYYADKLVRDAVLCEVEKIFVANEFERRETASGVFEFETPELKIEIKTVSLGELGDALEYDEKQSAACEKRARETRGKIAKAAFPTAAIVEIKHKKDFETKWINNKKFCFDPKKALRVGFAQTNRLTQFINSTHGKTPDYEKNLPHTAKAAVLDALRQIGVLPELPHLDKKVFARPVNYAGFWILKPGGKPETFLPIVIRIPADGLSVSAKARGMSEFLPYAEFLIALANKGWNCLQSKDRYQAGGVLKSWLQNDLAGDEDLLLLLAPQNSRQCWSWLSNPNLTADAIRFNSFEAGNAPAELPFLRVVNIRTDERSETPEHFAENSFDGKPSFLSGVYPIHERAFYSLAGKPVTQSKLRRDAEKSTRPEMSAWNPSLIEMNAAFLQPNDEPQNWAKLAHLLRNVSANFADETKLPLPLHLAKKADEYLPDFEAREDESE